MWIGKLFESLMVDGGSVFIYKKVFALGIRKMRPSWFFKGYMMFWEGYKLEI